MTMLSPSEVAQALHDRFNAGDMEGVYALWAPDIRYASPGVRIEGQAARIAAEQAWVTAFPGAQNSSIRKAVDGNTVVEEVAFTGSHTGPLVTPEGTVPATNRALDGRLISWLVIKDGLVVEQTITFDRADLLTQLGVLPAASAKAAA